MKIGILSDVHANLPALRTVLDDLYKIDRIVHAGDVVGYNPYPSGTVQIFKKYGINSIKGNHDRALVQSDAKDRFYASASKAAKKSLQWTAREIDADSRTYLEGLPTELRLIDGLIRIVHGSPNNPDEYLYPNDINPQLLSDERLLIIGHTHIQGKFQYDEGTVLNPGSVGQPRDGTKAKYAIVDTESWQIDLKQVAYDVETVTNKIAAQGLPDRTAELLEMGEE